MIYFDDRHTKLAALGEGKEFNLFFFATKNRASFLIREACHELKRGNNLQLFSLVCQTGEWMKNICALGSRDLFTFLAALFSFRTAIESARLEREMSRAVLFWSITIGIILAPEKCLKKKLFCGGCEMISLFFKKKEFLLMRLNDVFFIFRSCPVSGGISDGLISFGRIGRSAYFDGLPRSVELR